MRVCRGAPPCAPAWRLMLVLLRAHTEFFLRFAMKAAKPSDAPTD